MSEWQPIETAPKDGTPVDIWIKSPHGGGRVAYAWWVENELDDSCPKDIAIRGGWFAENYDYDLPGFCDRPKREGREYYREATHWMPLPAPPAQ